MSMSIFGVTELIDVLEDVKTRYADGVAYVTGPTAEYAIYLEMGTSKMEAYPFLFPAMRDVANSWGKYGDPSAFNSTEAVVKAIAYDIEAQAKKNVEAAKSSGRSPGTDSSHPKVQTGNLRSSIKTERVR